MSFGRGRPSWKVLGEGTSVGGAAVEVVSSESGMAPLRRIAKKRDRNKIQERGGDGVAYE